MIKNKIIVILIVFLISCTSEKVDDRFRILGYTVGDSLKSEIDTMKVLDKPFLRACNKKEKRLEYYLINNHIISLTYKNLTEIEFNNFKNEISNKLNSEPIISINKTLSGIVFRGTEFFWVDSLNGDEIYLWQSPEEEKTKAGSLHIDNPVISKTLFQKYDPEYYLDTIIPEIVEFEEKNE
jgi:hypothetical protein